MSLPSAEGRWPVSRLTPCLAFLVLLAPGTAARGPASEGSETSPLDHTALLEALDQGIDMVSEDRIASARIGVAALICREALAVIRRAEGETSGERLQSYLLAPGDLCSNEDPVACKQAWLACRGALLSIFGAKSDPSEEGVLVARTQGSADLAMSYFLFARSDSVAALLASTLLRGGKQSEAAVEAGDLPGGPGGQDGEPWCHLCREAVVVLQDWGVTTASGRNSFILVRAGDELRALGEKKRARQAYEWARDIAPLSEVPGLRLVALDEGNLDRLLDLGEDLERRSLEQAATAAYRRALLAASRWSRKARRALVRWALLSARQGRLGDDEIDSLSHQLDLEPTPLLELRAALGQLGSPQDLGGFWREQPGGPATIAAAALAEGRRLLATEDYSKAAAVLRSGLHTASIAGTEEPARAERVKLLFALAGLYSERGNDLPDGPGALITFAERLAAEEAEPHWKAEYLIAAGRSLLRAAEIGGNRFELRQRAQNYLLQAAELQASLPAPSEHAQELYLRLAELHAESEPERSCSEMGRAVAASLDHDLLRAAREHLATAAETCAETPQGGQLDQLARLRLQLEGHDDAEWDAEGGWRHLLEEISTWAPAFANRQRFKLAVDLGSRCRETRTAAQCSELFEEALTLVERGTEPSSTGDFVRLEKSVLAVVGQSPSMNLRGWFDYRESYGRFSQYRRSFPAPGASPGTRARLGISDDVFTAVEIRRFLRRYPDGLLPSYGYHLDIYGHMVGIHPGCWNRESRMQALSKDLRAYFKEQNPQRPIKVDLERPGLGYPVAGGIGSDLFDCQKAWARFPELRGDAEGDR